MATTINMGLKRNALFCDVGQFGQGKNLKATAVREYRSLPTYKFVKAVKLFNNITPGPEVKMVGIAEDDLCTGRRQLIGRQRFDRTQRSHRHEDRGFHFSAGRLNDPGSGTGGCGFGNYVKVKYTHFIKRIGAVYQRLVVRGLWSVVRCGLLSAAPVFFAKDN
jgi:hypothetical protein